MPRNRKPSRTDFGKLLGELQRTYAWLAEQTGLNQSMVRHYWNGANQPPEDLVAWLRRRVDEQRAWQRKDPAPVWEDD